LKASRELRYPLSLDEILRMFPRAKARFLEATILAGLLKADPSLYIPRTCPRLIDDSEIRGRIMAGALMAASKLKKPRNSLKPQTLTAVAIYLACKELGLGGSTVEDSLCFRH